MANSDDEIKPAADSNQSNDSVPQSDRLFSSSSNLGATLENPTVPQVRNQSEMRLPRQSGQTSSQVPAAGFTPPPRISNSAGPKAGGFAGAFGQSPPAGSGGSKSGAQLLQNVANAALNTEGGAKKKVQAVTKAAVQFGLREGVDIFIKLVPELVATGAGIIIVVLGFLLLNIVWLFGWFNSAFDVLKFYEKFIIAFVNSILIFIATVALVFLVMGFCYTQSYAVNFLVTTGILPKELAFCQVVYDSIGADSGAITPKLGGGSGFGDDDPGKGGTCQINQKACQVGRFEAENSKSGCGWNAEFMSRVCALESAGGNPKIASGTDKCNVMVTNPETGKKDYLSYSIGLFQINMISSADPKLFPECQGVVVPLDTTRGYPDDKLAGELGGCAVGPAKTAGGNTYCPLRKCGFPEGKNPVKAEADYWACYKALGDPDRNIANACRLYKKRNNSCAWTASSNTCAGKTVCP